MGFFIIAMVGVSLFPITLTIWIFTGFGLVEYALNKFMYYDEM